MVLGKRKKPDSNHKPGTDKDKALKSGTQDGDGVDGEGPLTEEFVLCDFEEAPTFMKINPFILHGYRPRFSLRLCVHSLFRLHNETWNIWTHVFAAVLFTVLFLHAALWLCEWQERFFTELIQQVYMVVCIVSFIISVLYHLFRCHSESCMISLARIDFCGIATGIIWSQIPGVVIVFECHPLILFSNITIMFFFSGFIICLAVFPQLSLPSYSKVRLTAFTVMSIFGVVPVSQWLWMRGFDHPEVDQFLWKMFVSYGIFVLGMVFFVSKWPERQFPSRFTSLWVQSHTLWHIAVLGGTLWLYFIGMEYYYFTNSRDCSLVV